MGVTGLRFVITGSAGGIGAGTARLAASRGAKVVVSDVNHEAGEALAGEICAAGGEAHYLPCDVSDEAQVQALMQGAAEAMGGIDVLHNNAGIHESMLDEGVDLESMSRATFEKILGVNLVGAWMCAKYALPHLSKSDQASIINAGSTASWTGYPNCNAYGASKGGIALLTRHLAVELAPRKIRVNCYCPASVETNMVTQFLDAAPDAEAMIGTMTATHLVPRLGQPVDVAELVCFLAGPESSFVNGVVWLIDGGSLAWRGTLDILGMAPGSA